MENILFVIIHHSNNDTHTNALLRCLESIRRIYPKNTIIICKTSVSPISNVFDKYENIEYINTPHDNSHVYGAMFLLNKLLIQHETDFIFVNNQRHYTDFILLHDSIVMIKSLDNSILLQNFYFLWHFNDFKMDYENYFIELLQFSKLNVEQRQQIFDMYQKDNNVKWTGVFGPMFGGKIEVLKNIIDKMGINTTFLEYVSSREQLEVAERYISCFVSFLDIVKPNTSLNDSIFKQPNAFTYTNFLNLDEILLLTTETKYDGYFYKLWYGRQI